MAKEEFINRAIKGLIPELVESEGERIRNWICGIIENLGEPADEDAERELDIMQPLALAWLEKQKEQKPAKWSDSFEENIRNLLHDKLTWHSDDGSISTTVFIDDKTIKDIVMGIWFYVGKEAMKNPNMELPKEEWSEEDEKQERRNNMIPDRIFIDEAAEKYADESTFDDRNLHQQCWLSKPEPSGWRGRE